jgi:diadenylate cyclase
MTPLLIAFELPWIFTRLTPLALLDIFVVAVIFFWLLTVARGTRAMPLLRGIAILLGMIAVLSTTLNLTALRRLLEIAFPALVIAVPVIFQPELRRALEQLGQTRTWLNLPFAHTEEDIEKTIDEISRAVVQLSRQRIGALIVIERETGLQEYADRGVPEDAILTRQTLIQIFTPNTPLHDGAVIVRQNRILAAAVVLPLTEAPIGGTLGTRHRAAVGISEQSDAIAIVVSEETGQISMAMGGRLVRDLTHDKLKATLRARLRVDRDDHGDTGRPHLFSRGSRGLRKPRNPKTEATADGERPAAD